MALIFEKPREFRFFTLLLPVIVGILISVFLPASIKSFLLPLALPLLITVLATTLFWALKSFKINVAIPFSFSLFLLVLIISFLRAEVYIAKPNLNQLDQEEVYFTACVKQKFKQNEFQTKLFTNLICVQSDSFSFHKSQDVLLKIKKDSFQNYSIGDTIIGVGFFKRIESNKNPAAFDMQQFYGTKNVLYQISTEKEKVLHLKNQNWTVFNLASKCQHYLISVIDDHIQQKQSKDLLCALLVGHKLYLEDSTKEIFTQTGAAHILAVSGFHLGIIFLVLRFLIGSISKGGIAKRLFKLFLYLLFIWGYTFITGNAASVCRAASMLSIVLIGQSLQRSPSSWNCLGLSGVILLAINPLYIFQVGFQLSYGAMAGIILFTNKIYRSIHIKNNILKYFWALSSMSLAAQVFVLPVAIYYFHQIPIMFLVSSVIAIPMATCIVFLGLTLLIIQPFSLSMATILAHLINYLIQLLLNALSWIGQFQPEQLSKIYMSTTDLFLIIVCILITLLYLHKRSFLKFILVALSITGASLIINFNHVERINFNGLVIYSNYSNPILEIATDQKVYTFSNKQDPFQSFISGGFHIKHGVRNQEQIAFNADFTSDFIQKRSAHIFIQNTQIVIVDRDLKIYPTLFQASQNLIFWIVDQRNESFDINSIPENALVVIDEKVPPWISEKMKEQLKQLSIPYHDIQEKEAFIHTFQKT